MIHTVDPNFLTSKYPKCAVDGGVFFWLALLTPEQVEFLKASTIGTVSAILPNAPWNLGESVSVHPNEMPVLGKSQRKQSQGIGKRAAVDVRTQFSAPIGLTFLSTAEGGMNSFQEYDYLSPASAEIRVYMLDTEVDISHMDFKNTELSGTGQ